MEVHGLAARHHCCIVVLNQKLNTNQLSPKKFLQWAPRPAPFMPGLHCMQATNDNGLPFVSVYRQTAKEAEEWMRGFDKSRLQTFFMRHAESEIDMYDHHR